MMRSESDLRTSAIAALLLVSTACATGEVGMLAGPCRDDGTCERALSCERGVCVHPQADADLPDADPLDGGAMDAGSDDAGPDDAGMPEDAGVDAGRERDAGPADAGVDAPWDAALQPPPPPSPPESAGPIDPSPGPRTCAIAGRAQDVELDWERHRAWLSLPTTREVVRLDLATCAVARVAIAGRPERLHFDPYRDEVVVTIAINEPWQTASSGWIAAIDATTAALDAPIALAVDPWDVVSDGRGRAYVTTTHRVTQPTWVIVDLTTGVVDDPSWIGLPRPDPETELALHPARNRAYGIPAEGGPQDVHRFELVSSAPGYGSPSRGGYPPCGALRIDPRGVAIHTRCGEVFRATDVRSTDMTWIGTLGREWRDLAFDLDGNTAYVVGDTADLDVYDASTLTRLRTIPLATRPARVLSGHDYVALVTEIAAPESTRVELRRHADL